MPDHRPVRLRVEDLGHLAPLEQLPHVVAGGLHERGRIVPPEQVGGRLVGGVDRQGRVGHQHPFGQRDDEFGVADRQATGSCRLRGPDRVDVHGFLPPAPPVGARFVLVLSAATAPR